jgi:hypothetical protein
MHGCDLDDLNSSFASPKLDIAMTMSLWFGSKIEIHPWHVSYPMEFADFTGNTEQLREHREKGYKGSVAYARAAVSSSTLHHFACTQKP